MSEVLTGWGHVVEVASLDSPNDSWVSEFPLKVYALGPARSSYAFAPNVVSWLEDHASSFDVVTVRGIWQFHSFAARCAMKRLSRPYFVFTHGMLDPWFKRTYPLKHLKKCLYWPWGEYRVLRDAAGVCFTCEEERVLARESFRPYKCREVVVSYGTARPAGDPEAQKETFLARFPHLRGKRVLLSLGRIHPKKGCDLLISAFAKIAVQDETLHLVMAGPDQTGWQAALQQRAKLEGIAERITWPGMLSGDAKWGAFHSAEAFVLPSHQENFGIAVAEALACGLPVLISDKVNIWREIQEDGAGLVAPDTLEGTLHLLKSWVELPAARQLQMHQSALQCFESRFEIHRAAQSFLDAVQSVPASS
jgi:glycosyltransferase involved in cell wall biosynthesis